MIPDIHAILEMIRAGECTVQQALQWINQHMENADLRDHFAGLALQGLIAQSMGTALGSDPVHGARYAYQAADEMLKARLS